MGLLSAFGRWRNHNQSSGRPFLGYTLQTTGIREWLPGSPESLSRFAGGRTLETVSAFHPLAFAQAQKDKLWSALASQPARKADPAPDVSQQEISH